MMVYKVLITNIFVKCLMISYYVQNRRVTNKGLRDCAYIIYKQYFNCNLNTYTYTCTEMYIQGKTNLCYRIRLYFGLFLLFLYLSNYPLVRIIKVRPWFQELSELELRAPYAVRTVRGLFFQWKGELGHTSGIRSDGETCLGFGLQNQRQRGGKGGIPLTIDNSGLCPHDSLSLNLHSWKIWEFLIRKYKMCQDIQKFFGGPSLIWDPIA